MDCHLAVLVVERHASRYRPARSSGREPERGSRGLTCAVRRAAPQKPPCQKIGGIHTAASPPFDSTETRLSQYFSATRVLTWQSVTSVTLSSS
jgi:hypothetical protein